MGNKFLHAIVPWDKEMRNILERLTKDKIAYTENTHIASKFSSKYPELIDENFIDVVTTNYRKKQKKTIFILPPNVVSVPKNGIFSFHKIF